MSFPDVADAFWDWTNAVQFKLVNTTVADFEVSESELANITFDGVLEPIPERELMVKPEGQRNWKWWKLWTTYPLANGQIVQDSSGRQYRVMKQEDWSNGGHQQFQLVQDPPLNA